MSRHQAGRVGNELLQASLFRKIRCTMVTALMKKLTSRTFLAIAMLLLLALLLIPQAQGQSRRRGALGIKLLGGRITSTQKCDCQNSTLLEVGPPVGGRFMLTPATRRYRYGVFNIGTWVLGIAGSNEMECSNPCIKGCCKAGSGNPIKQVSTSGR